MKLLNMTMVCVGAMALCGLGGIASAEEASREFQIDAQPISDALNVFARQSGLQVVIDWTDGVHVITPRVAGEFTPQAALRKLLIGTSLAYEFLNDSTVAIRPRRAAAPAEQPSGAPSVRLQPANDMSLAQASGDETARTEELQKTDGGRPSSQELVVTGTRLGSRFEGMSTVQVITADEMREAGISSIAEALQRLPASSGIANGGAATGSTALGGSGDAVVGATGANLRGLGVGSTLVLLNGRRVVTYGYASGTTSAFVNLDSLPFGAIERIEVLKSGASAMYGSDAISGVINVILKASYDGADIHAEAGVSGHGDSLGGTFSGLIGKGHLEADGYNLLLNLEHRSVDGFDFADRDITRSSDLRRFGLDDFRLPGSNSVNVSTLTGAYLGTVFPCPPGALRADGTCTHDQNRDTAALADRGSTSMFLSGSWLRGPAVLYSELSYSQDDTQVSSSQTDMFVGLASTELQSGVYPATYTFPGSDTEPLAFGMYVATEFGRRVLEVTSANYRAVAGVRGEAAGWSWDMSGTWNQGDATQRYENVVRTEELLYSVLGLIPPAYPLKPSVLDNAQRERLAPPFENTSRATLLGADFSTSRALFDLPAGQAEVAIGAEFRREEIDLASDDGLDAREYVDIVIVRDVVDSRTISSAFGEVGVPLTTRSSLQLAARYDAYSKARQATRDPGSALTLKAAISFEPTEWLSVRAGYDEGFRAPSMFETSLESFGTTLVSTFDPVRCPVTGAQTDCLRVDGINGANPDLKSEHSNSTYLGVLLRPTEGLKLSLDFFEIERDEEIGRPSPAFLFANEALYPGRIERGPPDVPGLPGPVTFLDLRYLNIGNTRVRGADFGLQYQWRIGGQSWLRASLDATHIAEHDKRASNVSAVSSVAGYYNNPRWRSTSAITLGRSALSTTLSVSYTDSFKQAESSLSACLYEQAFPSACRIGSFTTVNWTSSLQLTDKTRLYVAISNLFDKQPPFDLTYQRIVNTSFHDLRGRYFRVQVAHSFD